eukprot:350320-Chlamydomonas_euryale.AAC.2
MEQINHKQRLRGHAPQTPYENAPQTALSGTCFADPLQKRSTNSAVGKQAPTTLIPCSMG